MTVYTEIIVLIILVYLGGWKRFRDTDIQRVQVDTNIEHAIRLNENVIRSRNMGIENLTNVSSTLGTAQLLVKIRISYQICFQI